MQIIGLIVEYNPFHNGHLYHINKAKEITGADLTIAITTTYFSMRGDVSVIDKKQKTEVALAAGIDIVLELPYLLGCQNADIFAYNNVQFLNKFKVNKIVSGSETADLELIKKIAELDSTEEFQQHIKNYLKQGFSYRKSFSEALKKYNIYDLKANDLLNLKYYQAIQKINPQIELKLIKRIHNNYHDQVLNTSQIQSATALRTIDDISQYVPNFALKSYQKRPFMYIDCFTQIYNHLVLTTELKKIYGAQEGLENRLIMTDSLKKLITELTSKRYTASRINRLITALLTNTTVESFNYNEPVLPRVLGFNKKGQSYLNAIKKEVNYITRIINGIHLVYDYELRIAKIFSNVFKENFIALEQSLPLKSQRD